MAISVTHAKVVSIPDDPNYDVGSDEWNAAHTVTGAAETATTITAGTGLTGGGSLAANRTISLSIDGLTEDTLPDFAADFLASYDASAATHKKVQLSNVVRTGTWTPTIVGGTVAGTGQTYFEQTANYTRIGQLVAISMNIFINSIGTATGAAKIGGLPFTNQTTANGYSGISLVYISNFTIASGFSFLGTLINPSDNKITLWETSTSGGANAFPNVSRFPLVQIVGNGIYRTEAA